MPDIVTSLKRENKDSLYLLTCLLGNVVATRKITGQGIEAIVASAHPHLDQKTTDTLIEKFAPTKPWYVLPKRLADHPDYCQLRHSSGTQMLATILHMEFTPEQNPYFELLMRSIPRQETFTAVPVEHFQPKLVSLYMFGTWDAKVPTHINMLAHIDQLTTVDLYFAAMQKLVGFPPTRGDRLSENLINLSFIEGSSFEEVNQEIQKFEEKNKVREGIGKRGTPGNFLMQLPSEYLKAIYFFGHINPSGETTLAFLDRLCEKYGAAKEIFSESIHEQSPRWRHSDRRWDIFRDPIHFFDFMGEETIGYLFDAFHIRNFDEMGRFLLETLPLHPQLYFMTHAKYLSHKHFISMAETVYEASLAARELAREKSPRTTRGGLDYFIQGDVLEAIVTAAHAYHSNEKALKPHPRAILQAAKGQKVELYDSKLNTFVNVGLHLTALFENRSLPLLREFFVQSSTDQTNDFAYIIDGIQQAFQNPGFREIFSKYIPRSRRKMPLLTFFANFGSKISSLEERIVKGEISLSQVDTLSALIEYEGIAPTPYLIEKLKEQPEKVQTLLADWKGLLSRSFDNSFDVSNPVHLNLGYTQFNAHLRNTTFRQHVKDNFKFTWNFDSYLTFLKDQDPSSSKLRSKHDIFEIDCAAYESSKLYEFITEVHTRATAIGRKVLVVPNLSYGYVPFIPLYERLVEQGIDIYLKAKIGSTQSHNNPSVFQASLFSGIEKRLLEEQPVIIIIDGTKHMVQHEKESREARYPDAYQGYLNYAIALNELLGFNVENAVGRFIGKEPEDITNLRKEMEYSMFLRDNSCDINTPREWYSFGLWNTAKLPLILRKDRKKTEVSTLFDPNTLCGPTMVFCNVGLLDEQIPEELFTRNGVVSEMGLRRYKHVPAYFDDSGKIINLELSLTSRGITIGNEIESLLKKAYAQYATHPVAAHTSYILADNQPMVAQLRS